MYTQEIKTLETWTRRKVNISIWVVHFDIVPYQLTGAYINF